MAGGRTDRGSRRRARAASVVVPFPRSEPGDRLDLVRFVPSGRSLVVGFTLVAAVLGAYWGARATSVFAVHEVEIRGAPPVVERDVRAVVGGVVGTSLLVVDAGVLEDRARSLPSVAGVSVDRAFPHRLVVKVAPERPVAVARRDDTAWLVTGSGEVVREIAVGSERGYPRLWLPKSVAVRLGGRLPASYGAAARALGAAPVAGPARRGKAGGPADGPQADVRGRGPPRRRRPGADLALKLAVAARVLQLLDDDIVYLDVSVPERPVASPYLKS